MKYINYALLIIVSFSITPLKTIAHELDNPKNMMPSPYGIIYKKNSWTNTADFITNGNATTALSGGYINISSLTQDDWNNTIHITNYRTKLEKWRFNLRFKIIAWSGSSYGLGFGLKSANEYVQNDIMGFIQTSNSGNGGLYILKSGRTIVATGTTPLGVALNDVIDLEGVFHDSIFQFSAHNITSGATATVSFTFASNGSTYVVPNTSNFSLMELGGTHQIQNLEISSEEFTGANLVTIGDSKTIGYFSNTFAGRYGAQLNNNYPSTLINAGGADRVTHVLSRMEELVRLAPNKYLLSIGSNDLRFGSTLSNLQNDYDSLVRLLQATGAMVYHIVLPEDYTKALGVNLLAFKNWVAATYPAYYINVWDSMAIGNLLKGIYDTGDGVHINQAGNNKIYEAIVASNKLNPQTLPIQLHSFTGTKLTNNKVRLKWELDPTQQADSYIILKSSDPTRFKELATLSSNLSAHYTYDDNALLPGTNYYKLKMIDKNNGEISESNTIIIRNEKMELEFSGWYKASADNYNFSINSAELQWMTWHVIDAAGRISSRGKKQVSQGINTIGINMSGTNNGIYYFMFTSGTLKKSTYTFVKQ
jgi:lysophospholipase L1-like esterase